MVPRAETLPDLALTGVPLDRSGLERRDDQLLTRLIADRATRVLELRGDRVPVRRDDAPGLELDLRPPRPTDADGLAVFLGRDADRTAYLGVVAATEDDVDAGLDADGEWLTLRQAGGQLRHLEAGLFTTLLAVANWHATHAHCPRCGAPTNQSEAGWLRVCPKDGSEHYPRTDPAVIMAVVDAEDRLLLGRGPQWPEGRFSVLAGFVEPGESFEAAVVREVEEEVGIVVTDVTYLGNQPWPFPSSVMIGFLARATSTRIEIDPHELAEARWVTRDGYRADLRSGAIKAPMGISIAKRIIEYWLGQSVEAVLAAEAP